MAALDDRYDVYDYCVKMGLDPDSNRNLGEARAAMYAEFWAKADARDKAAGTGKYAPGYEPPKPFRSDIGKLMRARYGASENPLPELQRFVPREGADPKEDE